MERKLFGIVERMARQMLLEGASVEALRRVEHLRLWIAGELRAVPAVDEGGGLMAAHVEAQRQARVLDGLLRAHRPEAPAPRGEARATPETAAKNRARMARHPLDALARRRDWREEYTWAAQEIADLYAALQRGLFQNAPAMDAVRVDSSRRRVRQPIEGLSEQQGRIRRDRYNPWCREMDRLKAHEVRRGLAVDAAGQTEAPWQGPGRAGRTLLALTMDVVVDGLPLADVDDLTGLRHGRTAELVAMALRRYGEIAGWLEARPEAPPREMHPLTRAAMRRAAKGVA
jgi:hypothetical protein